jgi:protein gp37
MNKQKDSSSIDWLKLNGRDGYSWNPVTGCNNGCPYCWARAITERFPARYPNGFAPTFYPERLVEPDRVATPANIFVASMGDLMAVEIAHWQIEAVLDVAWRNPQHLFFFLTKRPWRLPKFNPWPPNALVGASVDIHARLAPTLDFLSQVEARPRWISFEPLLEDMGQPGLAGIVEWVVIGAQTKPTVQPKKRWVADLVMAAVDAGTPVYMKDNLAFRPRLQQYPKVFEVGQMQLPGME